MLANGNEPTLRDISVTLNPDTPEWPGDTPFTCGWASLIGAGASVNVSSFTSSPHVGTHADAPLHVREGWSGSHELLLDAFYGPAIVVDVSSLTKEIEMEDLEKIQSRVSVPCSDAVFASSASILRQSIRETARICRCTI